MPFLFYHGSDIAFGGQLLNLGRIMRSAPLSACAVSLQGKLEESQERARWHLPALVVFSCFNLAAVGIFFAVFVGVVLSPPEPRNAIHLLVAGSFAFAVLVLGQFVYWSRLALTEFKGRSK